VGLVIVTGNWAVVHFSEGMMQLGSREGNYTKNGQQFGGKRKKQKRATISGPMSGVGKSHRDPGGSRGAVSGERGVLKKKKR